LTLFDLLFILVFVATAAALLFAAYAAIRGRFAQAGRVVLRTAIFWTVYLGIVVAVSLKTPRRVVAIGEQRCFDDWCITVERVSHLPGAGPGDSAGSPVSVVLSVSSEAKRVRQSAPDNAVFLENAQGKRYPARPAGAQPSFGTMIGPGESYETIREFDVPMNTQIVGLVVRHGGNGPGSVIIGDDAALFHKPAIVKLD
jgi:hypothetical protein